MTLKRRWSRKPKSRSSKVRSSSSSAAPGKRSKAGIGENREKRLIKCEKSANANQPPQQNSGRQLLMRDFDQIYGLKNHNNVCFAIAPSQLLLSQSQITEAMAHLEYADDEKKPSLRGIMARDGIISLSKFASSYLNDDSKDEKNTLFQHFIGKMWIDLYQYQPGNFEDTAEFVQRLMDLIEDNAMNPFAVLDLFNYTLDFDESLPKTICKSCDRVMPSLFHGKIMEVSIQKGYKVVRTMQRCVQDLLRQNLSCSFCGYVKEVQIERNLTVAPRFLLIRLDRFKIGKKGVPRKDRTKVKFEMELQVSNSRYALCGYVSHIGGTALRGHYVSLLNFGPETQILVDDARIERLQSQETFLEMYTQDCYLFLYRKIQDDDLRDNTLQKGAPSKLSAEVSSLPRRILKETQRLMQEPVPGISAVPDDNNARYFHVIVTGPEDSPFEGGLFKLELFLPEDYPMSAPKVRFITKIYHPNIDRLGRIGLNILKDNWGAAMQIRTVLLSIQALLSAPNPDDPLENDVAELWKANEAEAIRNAKEWTRRYAMDN